MRSEYVQDQKKINCHLTISIHVKTAKEVGCYSVTFHWMIRWQTSKTTRRLSHPVKKKFLCPNIYSENFCLIVCRCPPPKKKRMGYHLRHWKLGQYRPTMLCLFLLQEQHSPNKRRYLTFSEKSNQLLWSIGLKTANRALYGTTLINLQTRYRENGTWIIFVWGKQLFSRNLEFSPVTDSSIHSPMSQSVSCFFFPLTIHWNYQI